MNYAKRYRFAVKRCRHFLRKGNRRKAIRLLEYAQWLAGQAESFCRMRGWGDGEISWRNAGQELDDISADLFAEMSLAEIRDAYPKKAGKARGRNPQCYP